MARTARTELADLGSALIALAGALRPTRSPGAPAISSHPNAMATVRAGSPAKPGCSECWRLRFLQTAPSSTTAARSRIAPMYLPLALGALSIAVSGHGVSDRRAGAHAVRDTVYALAGATGLAGTGFHLYNVTKRPGGISWLNLFYAAPIGAPLALLLSGLLGFTAERVRDACAWHDAADLGFPAGRAMAALTALGLLGTVGEAGLLHFRGAYHDPAMFLPVTVPPGCCGAARRTPRWRRAAGIGWFTRWWLRLTAAVGLAGVGFHAFGVRANMGGWRNWSQNVLNGPPIPAPPSFTGLALAGLAALGLLEDAPDALIASPAMTC